MDLVDAACRAFIRHNPNPEDPVSETQVAKYGNERKQASVAEIEDAVEQMTRGDTFQAERGKRVANAAAVNKMFVARASAGEPIGIKVLDAGKDDVKAWAKVAAYRGDPANPILWAEEFVQINHELTRQKLIFDAIDRGVWLYDPEQDKKINVRVEFTMRGDVPTPTDPRVQLHLIRLALAKKIFAEREAVTHARERAQRQVLASEWREQGEQDAEQEEMDEVDRLRADRGGGVDLDSAIPFGPLRGQTWRGAAGTPEGRTLLQGVTTSAKVPKYAEAARTALASPGGAGGASARPPDEVVPPAKPRGRQRRVEAEPPRGPTPGATPSGSGPAPTSSATSTPADSTPRPSPASSPASTPTSGAATAAPAGGPAPVGAPGNVPAPRPEPPPPAAPSASTVAVAEDAARREAAAKEKAALLQAVTNTVARWPYVIVEDQLVGYELAISTIRGNPTTLAQADVEDVRRLHAHVVNHDKVWEDAKKVIGSVDATLVRLNELAREHRVEKFFAAAMRRSVLDEIRQAIVAGPTPAAPPQPELKPA